MDNLNVVEKVNVKSKNLDVLSEYEKTKRKRAMNFAVIGGCYPASRLQPYLLMSTQVTWMQERVP